MSSLNITSNYLKGSDFEKMVGQALEREYKTAFRKQSISIGHPPKAHIFDLVSKDKTIIVECKNCSWTKTGNIPSAKIACLNEAALFSPFYHKIRKG